MNVIEQDNDLVIIKNGTNETPSIFFLDKEKYDSLKKIKKTYPIEDFEVLTDEGWSSAINLHVTIPYDVFELKTKSGLNMKCADNHIVFMEDFSEIFVCNLKKGDKIIIIGKDDANYDVDEIVSVESLGYSEEMFDLELDKDSKNRYFTNNILSHNTQLCKGLAEYLFNSEENLIRLDMSEYMEPHTVSKMIGSPPGYVGYDEGGQLTEQVKNKPYSVVLFDEIEKAHPLVSNILLQILDEGKLTDSLGTTVDFKNTIIIMTSNIGTKDLEIKAVGFNSERNEEDNEAVIAKALKKVFRPEFINRIDEQIIFNKLKKEDVLKIVDIHLREVEKRVEDKGMKLNVSKKIRELISDEGFSEEFGARPILRAIIRCVQTPVSKELLKGTFKKGETIKVDYDSKKDEIKVLKEK